MSRILVLRMYTCRKKGFKKRIQIGTQYRYSFYRTRRWGDILVTFRTNHRNPLTLVLLPFIRFLKQFVYESSFKKKPVTTYIGVAIVFLYIRLCFLFASCPDVLTRLNHARGFKMPVIATAADSNGHTILPCNIPFSSFCRFLMGVVFLLFIFRPHDVGLCLYPKKKGPALAISIHIQNRIITAHHCLLRSIC